MRRVLVLVMLSAVVVSAQEPPTSTTPRGQDIVARDGDRIILEDDARIHIVRRRQATVRTIFHPAERMLIVLADHQKPGEAPDGRIDFAFNYFDLEGTWPLGERWEAFTTMEEYSGTPQLPRGIGLATPQGLVQVLASVGGEGMQFKEPAAAAVLLFRGAGGGGLKGLSFDEAERQQLAAAARRATSTGSGASTLVSGSIESTTGVVSASGPSVTLSAVRVGGSAPVKIRDVAPVYPDAARQANVRGVVVLEVNVGTDGAVTAARVLRSVPLLDQAALDAVRQWQYQPVVVDGKPTAVTLTVPVPIAPPE